MTDSCEQCNAYKDLNGERGLCRASKPQVLLLAVEQGPMLSGNRRAMKPVMGTFWAEVDKGDWCREFQLAGTAASSSHPVNLVLQPNHTVEKVGDIMKISPNTQLTFLNDEPQGEVSKINGK